MSSTGLLSLLQLSDPTLPIGSYAHSNGLETYVQFGIVRDLTTARTFITQMLCQNLHYTDAAFASLAYDAAMQNDAHRIIELDDECTAVKLPKESRHASQKLGIRLLKIFEPGTGNELLLNYKKSIQQHRALGHYSIVFGMYACALGILKADALTGFYYNAAVAMVTNSVKLIPLGQQDGQEMLFSLQPLITTLVKNSLVPAVDKIGLCCTGFDIRCMQHEQLYSRLYMS